MAYAGSYGTVESFPSASTFRRWLRAMVKHYSAPQNHRNDLTSLIPCVMPRSIPPMQP